MLLKDHLFQLCLSFCSQEDPHPSYLGTGLQNLSPIPLEGPGLKGQGQEGHTPRSTRSGPKSAKVKWWLNKSQVQDSFYQHMPA